ncbi:hypothetical protein [Camelpox virus]|uniref:Uncharacterized protein n=3 Tax=Camelpox virus TaxID=28873 RepID=Q8V2K5_CAMPM|nr:CMLV173 [Camelpox virus]AAG37671.1 CMP170L [Camelpox virus CMS]AAL73880.1 hypothetical protein [Camelpox virus M-96]AKU40544.1 hypothetical protein TT95_00186 [Camelpox virus]WIG62383.1 hypothetical protein DIBLKBHL_00184 [Camelpox virus]
MILTAFTFCVISTTLHLTLANSPGGHRLQHRLLVLSRYSPSAHDPFTGACGGGVGISAVTNVVMYKIVHTARNSLYPFFDIIYYNKKVFF